MSALESGFAPLTGGSWVRVAFLDESGIGSLKHDPELVVAGVIVDADRCVLLLQEYLTRLMDVVTPDGVKRPEYFHAKDIWHGTGDFKKAEWPDTVRFHILDELADIPRMFELPIVCGSRNRIAFQQQYPVMPPEEQLIGCYQVAATVALVQVEYYMKRGNDVAANEVASVFFEHNDKVVRRTRDTFRFLRSPRIAGLPGDIGKNLPLTRIFDSPCYQEKSDASILQVADFCAWAIKRMHAKAKGWERYYKKLKPWMVFHYRDGRDELARPR